MTISTEKLFSQDVESNVCLSSLVEVDKLLASGKAEEAGKALKAVMLSLGENPGSAISHEAHLSALAENIVLLQNQFDSILKLVAPVLGVQSSDIA